MIVDEVRGGARFGRCYRCSTACPPNESFDMKWEDKRNRGARPFDPVGRSPPANHLRRRIRSSPALLLQQPYPLCDLHLTGPLGVCGSCTRWIFPAVKKRKRRIRRPSFFFFFEAEAS